MAQRDLRHGGGAGTLQGFRAVDDPAGRRTTRAAVTSDGVREESSRRKQMLIRALIYIAGTHVFAGFVVLLFAVGGRH